MDLSGFAIAVVGLGLMGGSLALALRDRCRTLLGVDPDPAALALAARRKIVDRAAPDPAALLHEADLIVLALPRQEMLDLIPRLPQLHPGGPVVLDLGSTKRDIARALDALPARFEVLPAHPICGKETSGLTQAEADLYRGAPFVLSPLSRSTERARRAGESLARAVGAYPVWMSPETHDARIARTSHLPYLLACALSLSAGQETDTLVGPGFRSSARLAGTTSSLGLEMLLGNRDNLLAALGGFRNRLDALEAALAAADRPALSTGLQEARSAYLSLTANPDP